MPLLRFLSRETADAPRGAILAMTVLSGLATSSLLALVNLGAELSAAQGAMRLGLALTFLAMLGVVLGARGFALNHLVAVLEQALLRLRLRLIERLCHRDPQEVIQQHQAGAYIPLTQDIRQLSQAMLALAPLAESLLILVATLAYLGWLSMPSLGAVLVIACVALALYWPILVHSITRARTMADEYDHFARVVGQFQHETFYPEPGQDDAVTRLCEQRDRARRWRLDAQIGQTWLFIVSRGMFYAMLLVLVFFLPSWFPEASITVHQVTGAVLFLIAPLHHLVESVPLFSQVNAALTRLYALEDGLADSCQTAAP